MSNKDIIQFQDLVSHLPKLIKKLPSIIEGTRLLRLQDKSTPMGIGLCLENATERNPNGIAILYRNVRLSYDMFNRWTNQVAHALRSLGIKKGDTIVLFIENRPELLAYAAGIAKLGAVSAMVNTHLTGDSLRHSIQLVEPKLIIVGAELLDVYESIRESLRSQERKEAYLPDHNTYLDPGTCPKNYLPIAQIIREFPAHNPDSSKTIYSHDACFYIYTSGTTGLPKAGIFSHGRWIKLYGGIGKITLTLNQNDVLYCALPLYHSTALCVCWSAVLAGASGFAIRRKFSASKFWLDAKQYHATCIAYIGELCRYLISQPEDLRDRDHPVTKMIGNGLRPYLWSGFKQRFNIQEVYEFYGASDGNIGFTNLFNFDNTVGFSPNRYAIVKYNRDTDEPIRNVKGRVERVRQGEVGLLISQINDRDPLDGYTEKRQTEKVIVKNAFESGDRWFNTGDLLRDLGWRHAQFVDRIGDTFRWKGENVSTMEVENILVEFPLIREAVVYGVEIPKTEGRAGMAAITLEPGLTFDAIEIDELYDFLKAKLPGYAIPLFLRIQSSLSTTSTFKYVKTKLQDEAYDLRKVLESILVLRPQIGYVILDQTMYEQIISGEMQL
ncbi:MAG: long-chain-acyl-CoA synthetase [Pseudomonadota bacterium]